jgi:catechol 2,3-dioxygenase-like lactoylglutathione lyase family enzyme
MVNESDFGLAELGQIAVVVADLERATAFYRDTLGMQLLFEAPGMSFFRCGDVRLMLGLPQREDDPTSHILYFRVDDIDAACETLKGRGVDFIRPPRRVHRDEEHELWLAFFRDPAGHTLALMNERPMRGGLRRPPE